jgi:acetyltransferase-like isoleucine patch superfamily enzyme
LKKEMKALIAPIFWVIMNRLRHHQVESMEVGFKARIGRKVVIRKGSEVGSAVEIGDYSYISGPRAYVEAATIGRFCSIARQTTIGVSDHDYRLVTSHPFIIDPSYGIANEMQRAKQKPPPIIGHDVWIGMSSFVMRGVKIGHGAVVAANSVVTRDVEPYAIVGGNPARHIKSRFPPHIVEALLEIQWWNWGEEKLRESLASFENIEEFVVRHRA